MMTVSFCEYFNDAIRILVILINTSSKKSLMMTDYQIKQYDYYLKFPYTMIPEKATTYGFIEDVNEYYSFFHWQPDLLRYRQSLDYLISKGFIKYLDKKGNKYYEVTELGIEVFKKIDNDYLKSLFIFCDECVIPKLSKMSQSKINEEINKKSNVLKLRGLI